MELYKLRTFIAVAEGRHLTRAAQRLHLSQPSASAHIKALEEELGLTLFIRTPRGMRLSREGEQLEAQVRTALEAIEALRRKAAELRSGLRGVVRIGLNIDSAYLRVSDLLTVMRRELPGIELHFSQKHSLEAVEEIRTGELDAAFVFVAPDDPDLRTRQLTTFKVVVVGPLPWSRDLREAGMENLADFPWVWTDRRCPFFQITHKLFEPFGRLPGKTVVVDRDSTIRKLVRAGAGLCLMVEPEALEASGNNELSIVTEPVATLDLAVLCLEKRAADPALRAVLEGVSRVWAQPRPQDREGLVRECAAS